MIFILINWIKILVTFILLLKASLHDLRSREIPDVIWLTMFFIAIPLNVVQYALSPFDLTSSVIQFLLVFILSVLMVYLGFGGADFKALLCLAVMFPIYPKTFDFTVVGFSFAFTVLMNSLLVELSMVLILVLINTTRRDFGVFMFLGYRVELEKIPRFHNLIEYVEDGKIKTSLRGVEIDDHLEELKRLGVKRVWVTPALPFIVFMLFGFILAITLGDLSILVLSEVFSLKS